MYMDVRVYAGQPTVLQLRANGKYKSKVDFVFWEVKRVKMPFMS